MVDQSERKILEMVEQGIISAEEGLRLIDAMGAGKSGDGEVNKSDLEGVKVSVEDVLEPAPRISEEELKRMKRLKRWWILPFAIGLLITTLGAVWMYTGYINRGFGWGFWLAWIPFIVGIFVVAVSFQTSRSVWLHVRIKQKPGESPPRISISLPLPISLAKWFMSVFGHKIPGLKDQPLGDLSELLDHISPEEPFYVHVNDKDDGEEVEVFIG
jgi:predicted RNA-binding protein